MSLYCKNATRDLHITHGDTHVAVDVLEHETEFMQIALVHLSFVRLLLARRSHIVHFLNEIQVRSGEGKSHM